mgnify:CR=1 FL=1
MVEFYILSLNCLANIVSYEDPKLDFSVLYSSCSECNAYTCASFLPLQEKHFMFGGELKEKEGRFGSSGNVSAVQIS